MDRIENHLNYNPWLRGINDEAKSIEALELSARPKGKVTKVLEDGLSELDLSGIAETIRFGDYRKVSPDNPLQLINHEAAAVPEAYFTFLFLIGGFKCRSVQLFNLGKEYLYHEVGRDKAIRNVVGPCVREWVVTGHASSYHRSFEESYPVKIILGRCDHGEYVYDRRYDNYSLISAEHTTNFNNCEEMLRHAMYRARENIKENWTEAAV
ncbi:MAG: hypothetical protein FWC22_07775 [Treponema sp.]|nr:hypothetical protein [Treponema sp.]